MHRILKQWFSPGTEYVPPSPQPGPHADYRGDLIPGLHAEHQALIAQLGVLERACRRGEELACREALERFSVLLQQHLLAEDRRLYGYFARYPNPSLEKAQHIDRLTTQMLEIGETLHRFIATYGQAPWTEELRERLQAEVPVIGSMLMHRIHEEEHTLYPLYQPGTG